MALSRIAVNSDLSNVFTKFGNTGSKSLSKIQSTNQSMNRVKTFHITSKKYYPEAPTIPLPYNVSEICNNETGRFTPERTRDITGAVILQSVSPCSGPMAKGSFNFSNSVKQDWHVDSYDCFGAVSLNGSMQSTVPKPFSSNGKSMHLNMPGGQWSSDGKYIAENMQKSHYASIKHGFLCSKMTQSVSGANFKNYSTSTSSTDANDSKKAQKLNISQADAQFLTLSKKDRLKQLCKEYGITVMIFHVGISLISLGVCYVAVTSGIDMTSLIERISAADDSKMQSLLTNSSQFLVAYTIHKIFAPVRLTVTFTMVPFVARYLRRIGFIKVRKPS